MTIYLINAPILTHYGQWDFSGPLSIAQVQERLANGFISAIGHEASSRVLSRILNIDIPTQRITVTMQPGDEALILRLPERLPEGKVLNEEELKALKFEFGWLKRLQ